jgi:PAS domain S-box-containing protein
MNKLRLILDAVPNGMMVIDERGVIVFVNSHIEQMFGYLREELIGRDVEALIPERFRAAHPGLRRHYANRPQPRPMGQGRDLFGLRKNATEFPVEIGLNPFYSGDRLLVAACVIDITERKRNEEHIQFIMHELSHRSKNLLTIVLGIANQTMRSGDIQQFENRLMALARCHDLLVEEKWEGAPIEALLSAQLNPFADVADRIDAAGPSLTLHPEAAQNIGLALHELATNAMKYGALSSSEGRVVIRWDIDDRQAQKVFRFFWEEHGGPPVSPPEHEGFGHKLLKRFSKETANADVNLMFAREGLCWRFECDERLILRH